MSEPPLTVSRPTHERGAGLERVQATCAGERIWFESADEVLAPEPETFLGLFLLPALERRTRLVTEAALDSTWLDGMRKLAAIYAHWWGTPSESPIEAPVQSAAGAPRGARVGACFTGGVDSFYTLVTGRDRIDTLVFAQGYDIGLDDAPRMAAFEASLREVASRTNKRAVLLRTNLKRHPVFGEVNWERTHGAALAALGLLLSGTLGTLILPSSYRRDRLIPWGSHPATDALWSTSRMAIVHDDASVGREEKVARIVHEPLAWNHLRVCWENRAPTGNCSRCQKCIRTMVAIASHGRLGDFTVFDRDTPLERLVDGLRVLPEHLLVPWAGLLELSLEPRVRRAVERLLHRSRGGPAARLARVLWRLSRARLGSARR